MFNLIFLYNGGMLNQLLQGVFGVADNIDWKDTEHYLGTMLTPVMWQYVGFYFVILVTGLNNISPDLYEAAEIDGADGWKRTRHITLPLLRNVLSTCLVLAITGALKVFDLPWVMMGAGIPMDQSWLTGTYMYNQAFLRGRRGLFLGHRRGDRGIGRGAGPARQYGVRAEGLLRGGGIGMSTMTAAAQKRHTGRFSLSQTIRYLILTVWGITTVLSLYLGHIEFLPGKGDDPFGLFLDPLALDRKFYTG